MFKISLTIASLLNILLLLGCSHSSRDRVESPAVVSESSPVENSAIASPDTASDKPVISQNNTLISGEGIGQVKFGMTFAEAKAVLGEEVEYVLEPHYIVDFDAISVRQDGEVLFYILHFAEQPLKDDDLITFLQTNNPAFQTAEGVHAGMLIKDAEKIYGKASLFTSEVESRESVNFQNEPKEKLYFGTFGGGANADIPAGIYPDPDTLPRDTTEYREDATIQYISVSCGLKICFEQN
ncbi:MULTISPECIES: hypothetical protein [Spirulina sp. CCY15215]|uniref:hypothetical protein n=1 Tax=Spirulina sp. CCY15215 TaxID=2767591 RepID=UPI00194FB76F|nr:hypothetical protein [Spirulina major]